ARDHLRSRHHDGAAGEAEIDLGATGDAGAEVDAARADILGAAAADGGAAGRAAALDHLRAGEDGDAVGEAVVELDAAGDLGAGIGAAGADGLRAAAVDDGRIGKAA